MLGTSQVVTHILRACPQSSLATPPLPYTTAHKKTEQIQDFNSWGGLVGPIDCLGYTNNYRDYYRAPESQRPGESPVICLLVQPPLSPPLTAALGSRRSQRRGIISLCYRPGAEGISAIHFGYGLSGSGNDVDAWALFDDGFGQSFFAGWPDRRCLMVDELSDRLRCWAHNTIALKVLWMRPTKSSILASQGLPWGIETFLFLGPSSAYTAFRRDTNLRLEEKHDPTPLD